MYLIILWKGISIAFLYLLLYVQFSIFSLHIINLSNIKKSWSGNIVSAILNCFTNFNVQKYHCHFKDIKLKISKQKQKYISKSSLHPNWTLSNSIKLNLWILRVKLNSRFFSLYYSFLWILWLDTINSKLLISNTIKPYNTEDRGRGWNWKKAGNPYHKG